MKECDIEKLFDYCNAVLDECLESGYEADFCMPMFGIIYKVGADGERTKTEEFEDPSGDSFEALARYACADGGIDNCEITQSDIVLDKKEQPNDLRLFSLEEVRYCAGRLLEQLNVGRDCDLFKACDLVIVEISYEIGTEKYQELVVTTADWYDIYGWPEKEEHPEWVVINEALDTLDTMRKQFIDLIQGMVGEDERIDFREDEKFHEVCDRAYVACFDRHDEVSMLNLDVVVVGHTIVGTSWGLDKNLEDMTAQELLQVYRCLCEYDEWKRTGKISYE